MALTVTIFNCQDLLQNFCGKVSLVAFDKTGTLTEDGLDFGCVVPFDEATVDFAEAVTELDRLPAGDICHYLRCCATCHSLTYVNARIVGDPMDLKMFAATGWVSNIMKLLGY